MILLKGSTSILYCQQSYRTRWQEAERALREAPPDWLNWLNIEERIAGLTLMLVVMYLVRRIGNRFQCGLLSFGLEIGDLSMQILAVGLHHVSLPGQQFGHRAFDAGDVVDQMAGCFVSALAALREQNEMPHDEQ